MHDVPRWSTPSPPGGVKALTEVAAGYPLTDAQARAVIKAGLDAEYNAGGIYAGITTDTTDLLNVALPYTDGTNYVLEVLGSDSDQVYFQDVLVSHPSGATNVRWRLNYMTSSVGGTPKSSILSGSMTQNGDGTATLTVLPAAYEFPVAGSGGAQVGVAIVGFNALTVTEASSTDTGACGADVLTGGRYGLSDSDADAGESRVRVAFRSNDNDKVPNGSTHASSGLVLAGTDGVIGPKGCSTTGSGIECTYTASEGRVKLENRNSYTAGDNGSSVTLEGPGTLYEVPFAGVHHNKSQSHPAMIPHNCPRMPHCHSAISCAVCGPVLEQDVSTLYMCSAVTAEETVVQDSSIPPLYRYITWLDLAPGDYLTVDTPGDATEDVVLAGDYSHCITTVQPLGNLENDLCHNVITGKVLGPAPVVLGDGTSWGGNRLAYWERGPVSDHSATSDAPRSMSCHSPSSPPSCTVHVTYVICQMHDVAWPGPYL